MSQPILGHTDAGKAVHIDIDRLVETRLLANANSGGGKSWLLRRILEQTHGKLQHLVIDPEGEFHTLREKFDYVLVARQGGDCLADPRSAGLLARRLLELNASAILDIYELRADERKRFVKLFLESLINAPKELWHPVLVVVDEAHVFCPQIGEAESADAVKDLATRGRKRGFCPLLATQRLSKLHKDAAAECNNVLIGRASQDVDMKRSSELLGFTERAQMTRLRTLEGGQFFAFGPAIAATGVIELKVGSVTTTHPKAGQRAATVAPARETVRKVLAQLADLPQEAAEEAKTVGELRFQVQRLERELAKKVPAAPAKPMVDPERDARIREEGARLVADRFLKERKLLEAPITALQTAFDKLKEIVSRDLSGLSKVDRVPPFAGRVDRIDRVPPDPGIRAAKKEPPYQMGQTRAPSPHGGNGDGSSSKLPGPDRKILDGLAEFEAIGIPKPARIQVALIANYTHPQSTGFVKALGRLNSNGLVSYPSPGTVALTDGGRELASAASSPLNSAELHARILRLLQPVHGKILRALIDEGGAPVDRADLASRVGYTHVQSTGFVKAIGRLSSLGLIEYPHPGKVRAGNILFLERQ